MDYTSFDWRSYIGLHKDVAAAGIASRAAAWEHWVTHGRHEGRVAPALASTRDRDEDDGYADFDWRAYLSLHPELRKLGVRSKASAWARAKVMFDSATPCASVQLHNSSENRYEAQQWNPSERNIDVLMLLPPTTSIACGGTRTALYFLAALEDLGLQTALYVLGGYDETVWHTMKFFRDDIQCDFQHVPSLSILGQQHLSVAVATAFSTVSLASTLYADTYIYYVQDDERTFFNQDDEAPTCLFNWQLADASYHDRSWNFLLRGDCLRTLPFPAMAAVTCVQLQPGPEFTNSQGWSPTSHNSKVDGATAYALRPMRILLAYYDQKARRLPELMRALALRARKELPAWEICTFPDKVEGFPCLGRLNQSKLREAFETARVGVCLSATNVSRLPLEMCYAGLLTVELKNANQLPEESFFLASAPTIEDVLAATLRAVAWSFGPDPCSPCRLYRQILQVSERNQLSTTAQHLMKFGRRFEESTRLLVMCMSHGNLGSDRMKVRLMEPFLAETAHLRVVSFPLDVNFNFQETMWPVLERLNGAVLYMARCMIIFHPRAEELLKHLASRNRIIYDPVDLLADGAAVCERIVSLAHWFHTLVAQNTWQREWLIGLGVPEEKVVCLPHSFDNGYLQVQHRLPAVPLTAPTLGFIGCVKRLHLHLVPWEDISRDVPIVILDSECWKQIPLSVLNAGQKCDWKTVLPNFNEMQIPFNVHLSIQDPAMSLHKTCTKVATAAALGHLVVANRTPANLDVLAADYPFYVDDTSVESFMTTWQLLQAAAEEGASAPALVKAQRMLESVRQVTSPEACAARLCSAVLSAVECVRTE